MANNLTDKKILIIEDDQFLAGIVSKEVEKQGGKMIHINNGEVAVDTIKKEGPDAILLDIMLPGMSGLDTLEKIKSDPKMKNIPVIIFSNFGDKDDMERGLKLGAVKFLIKSTVVPDELVQEVIAVVK